ncbi:hypothetical protein F4777DRAFT_8177 [Nemania sp. FL0916]|nr:hypothetical protein F4777DRAFT_8177 [Nemania sp. FL0916]
MKPPARVSLRLIARPTGPPLAYCFLAPTSRHIHSTSASPAVISSVTAPGPPPQPPSPAVDSSGARLARRKKHAALLEKAQEIRSANRPPTSSSTPSTSPTTTTAGSSPLAKRRFWKHVHVREVEGALEVHLDTRPLRRPSSKQIVRLPPTKPLLASAVALEWDLLVSAQQATRQHLIPLTSLVCRALDIADDDNDTNLNGGVGAEARDADTAAGGEEGAGGKSKGGRESLRAGIARTLLRYLDTDSLLCWAPEPRHGHDAPDAQGDSLRDKQRRAAEDVVAFLTTRVWPGVDINPVLDGESIVPRAQPPETRQIIHGWISGLSAFELAGLERAVLAGKGLLTAVRLVAEWSEGFAGAGARSQEKGGNEERKVFGVEEAARIASIEVDWQIANWGEVEDTHDVEKEDLRRQLGSVVLLVSGTGKP